MRMILAAGEQGVAAVVVTHDAQLASWADRVVLLRDGHVVDQTVRRRTQRRCSRRAVGPDLSGNRSPRWSSSAVMARLDKAVDICRIRSIVSRVLLILLPPMRQRMVCPDEPARTPSDLEVLR
jgi:ABC-type sugar transport system ATPase subunit